MSTTYWGIITQTITSTNDPRLSNGQVLIGAFSYQSDAADGTFCQRNSHAANQTLLASICCYFPNTANFNRSVANCSDGGYLTVTNAAVTDFYCSDQSGYLGTSFSLTGFSFRSNQSNDIGQEYQYLTTGSLTFTCPTPIPSAPSGAKVQINSP